jgi:hypothetical protein
VILLEGALDYAGLFPPASLGMAEAVERYAAYRRGPHRALLGRFVVPVARLNELSAAADALLARDPQGGLDLSVIGGADPLWDSQRIADVEAHHGPGGRSLFVRSVERKVVTAAEIGDVVRAHHDGGGRDLYLELPIDGDNLTALVEAVADAGALAKVRTGTPTVDGFPSSDALARFILACSSADVPFKATAGLHHAVRGEYPVDYAPESPCATMHGFLNLFVGCVLVYARKIGGDELRMLLEERAPNGFAVGPRTVRWRDFKAGAEEIADAREGLLRSVGTCSFEEPIAELREMGALA